MTDAQTILAFLQFCLNKGFVLCKPNDDDHYSPNGPDEDFCLIADFVREEF